MKVLFVEKNLRNEKLGIMYLSAALKAKGHHADLVQSDKENLDRKIKAFCPDFVAFSICTGDHKSALKTAQAVKRKYHIPNIFGGPHCTFFPEFSKSPGVDFTVTAQGESAIINIVEGRCKPGLVMGSLSPVLDKQPFPDREIFYQYPEFRDNPMKNIITSQACPNRCSYCFNHSYLALTKMYGNSHGWFKRRNPAEVIDEIKRIRQAYPLEKILFIDDCFIQNPAWLKDFLPGYTKDVALPWMCSLRVNTFDEEMAATLARSGLIMVNYALESADPEVQQRILNRGYIHNRDIIRAVELFGKYGIKARMQNMIGLPLPNALDDALNTLQFNLRHKVTDSWCSIFQPYPRTALGQYCVKHGYISKKQLSYCSDSFFNESRLRIKHKKAITALQKLWFFIVDSNIPLDLVRILINGKYTAAINGKLQQLRFKCSREQLYGLKPQEKSIPAKARKAGEKAMAISRMTLPALITKALGALHLPPEFVSIMASVKFNAAQKKDLVKYLNGEQVFPASPSTLDDKTGELLDPDKSIFRLGGLDPEIHDIRNISDDQYMGDIKGVYAKLQK